MLQPAKILRAARWEKRTTYLDRTDVYTLLPEHIGDSRSLDRVTGGGTRTVALNERRVSKVSELCRSVTSANEVLLAARTWLCDSWSLAIKVACSCPNDCSDWVSVSHGIV
jgi:hypothetical protein